MAAARRAAPKKPSKAEAARRKMVSKPAGKRKPSPMAKKKITNKEAAAILKKESKARAVKRAVKNHMKGNKPGRQSNKAA